MWCESCKKAFNCPAITVSKSTSQLVTVNTFASTTYNMESNLKQFVVKVACPLCGAGIQPG